MFYFIHRANIVSDQTNRLTRMKFYALASLEYALGHRDTLPDSGHWHAQILPYLTAENQKIDAKVAMNTALSGRKLGTIAHPQLVILFFESSQGPDADLNAIPRNSPSGQFAVIFADGHGSRQNCNSTDDLIAQSKKALDSPLSTP
jgi:hypothetical protein